MSICAELLLAVIALLLMLIYSEFTHFMRDIEESDGERSLSEEFKDGDDLK